MKLLAAAVAVAALASGEAAAQQRDGSLPPILIPPLRPRTAPLPPSGPPAPTQPEPPPAEQAPPENEDARRRPRIPAGGFTVLPAMSCLEAAAFDGRIEEPVTSSGNYQLWMSLNPGRREDGGPR